MSSATAVITVFIIVAILMLGAAFSFLELEKSNRSR
ncbi:MAG: hypothetical protein Ct9H300mP19_00820 [Dehalococcoidia bacterium]|nr:MAG: hypothetical protein CM1200mP39_04780 [Dehalococcoidia bacterium]GIT58134.1 MAG: hypothetical protein Ct9H300mP19_00820 [Dehalococcoidia bacterium]